MLDLAAAAAALLALAGVASLAALGLLVLPFVRACDAADQRGLSPFRAGAAVLLADGAALVGALLVLRRDVPAALAVVPLALPWAVAGAVRLVPTDRPTPAGRRGRHE